MHLTLSTAPFSQSVSRFTASVEQKLSSLLPIASVDQESLDSPQRNNEMFNQKTERGLIRYTAHMHLMAPYLH